MSEDTAQNDSVEVDPTEPTSTEQQPAETQDEDKPLGPAGEKAYYAEKERRKAAERSAKEQERALQELRTELERLKSGEEESETDRKIREAEAAALSRANERIVRAEVRAAAAGKLADPADALRFLDLSAFEVDADGGVDAETLNEAVTDLIAKKPYLAAQGTKRFQGSADGGARPSQPRRAASLEEALAAKIAAQTGA